MVLTDQQKGLLYRMFKNVQMQGTRNHFLQGQAPVPARTADGPDLRSRPAT